MERQSPTTRIRGFARLSVGLAVMASLVVLAAPTALASWAVHNGNDATQMTPPPVPGATDDQTCANRLVGETGYIVTVTGGTFTPPAPADLLAPTYEVWKAPPGLGITTFDAHQHFDTNGDPLPGYFFTDSTNNEVPALSLGTFLVPHDLSPVTPMTPIDGQAPGADGRYVYASWPFIAPLPDGVAVGDVLGLKPLFGFTFKSLTVIDCTPAPIAARVDVLPGINPNYVIPTITQPVLPVLIYGSGSLDVTKIASVKLGTAVPAALPSSLRWLLTPRDVNHDGRLDRLYFFSPSATGITCGQTTVSVTGTMSSGAQFTSSAPIRAVC